MRDPDEVMVYEARQQELVRVIVQSLHEATRDDSSEDGYVHTFLDLGTMCLYHAMRNINPFPQSKLLPMFTGLVHAPIDSFTDVPEEQDMLFVTVGMQLLESSRARVGNRYSRQQFATKLEPTA